MNLRQICLIFSDLEQAVLDLKQKLDNERTIRTESDANRMTMENQVMVGLVFLFSNGIIVLTGRSHADFNKTPFLYINL